MASAMRHVDALETISGESIGEGKARRATRVRNTQI
jgi:hypothetical protein